MTCVLPCDAEGLAKEECSFLAAFPSNTSIENVVQQTVESFPIDNLSIRCDASRLTLFVTDGRGNDLSGGSVSRRYGKRATNDIRGGFVRKVRVDTCFDRVTADIQNRRSCHGDDGNAAVNIECYRTLSNLIERGKEL